MSEFIYTVKTYKNYLTWKYLAQYSKDQKLASLSKKCITDIK